MARRPASQARAAAQVTYPIIVDPERVVARKYGMLGYQDDTPKEQQPKLPLVRFASLLPCVLLVLMMCAFDPSDCAQRVHHRPNAHDPADSHVPRHLRPVRAWRVLVLAHVPSRHCLQQL